MAGSRPRVLLIYPTQIKPDAFFGFLLPPLGLERIASFIEAFSTVRIMDLRFDENEWLNIARSFSPDFIGVNVKTTLYASRSYFVSDRLRALFPLAKIILGGLHASTDPKEALDHGDAVVVGDGEEAFGEIVKGKDFSEIKGIVFRNQAKEIINTGPRPFSANLDYLPPPARHLRPLHYRYSAAGLIPMDLLETSRGCTQYCPFCSPAAIHKGKWRAHSAQYVFSEVKRIWKRGAKYVMLTDDNFSGDLERAKEISELIVSEKIKIAFFCFLRPFEGRMDVKRAMVNAGFVMLSYGAESPNREQLKRYGKGFDDPSSFIRAVNREWHEAGARYIGNSFVFGDPQESAQDLSRFGDYARDLDPTYIEPLYSQPFPGTRYRDDLKGKNLLLDKNWDSFTEGRMLVRYPSFDENELRTERVRMWLRFFSPRKLVGGFRVPLYFFSVVGIPIKTVLAYMKACDYCVFGCILEDKFYFHRRRAMVKEYLTSHINSFSPEERDMTLFTDEFAKMIGLGPFIRVLNGKTLALEIRDKTSICTRFSICIRNDRIEKVIAGLDPIRADHMIRMSLSDAISLACGKGLEKSLAILKTFLYNIWSSVSQRF